MLKVVIYRLALSPRIQLKQKRYSIFITQVVTILAETVYSVRRVAEHFAPTAACCDTLALQLSCRQLLIA